MRPVDRGVVIPVMWVLQAVVVGGLVVAGVAARRGAKRLERVVEDLELEGAVFLGILGIARRLVSRYEPLEALVDEVPYAASIAGCRSSTVRGASSGPSSSRPPYSTELARHAGARGGPCGITSRWLPSQLLVADAAVGSSLLRQPSRLRDPPGEGCPGLSSQLDPVKRRHPEPCVPRSITTSDTRG